MKTGLYLITATILLNMWCVDISNAQQETAPTELTLELNENQLQCYFFQAQVTKPAPTVVLLQGFPSGKNDVLSLGKNLTKSNINALTFHYRGSFLSEGAFSLDGIQEDIQSIIEKLRNTELRTKFLIDTSNIFIGGYSLGGGLALAYAAGDPSIARVFSIAGTDHGTLANRYIGDQKFADMFNTVLNNLDGPPGPVMGLEEEWKSIISYPHDYDLIKIAPKLKGKNLLLIGGWNDTTNPVDDHLLPFYRALQKEGFENVTIKVYQCDHSFSEVEEQLFEDVLQWITSSTR